MKRRAANIFSLSFLDCICCGLGAVILLFVIVNAKAALRRDQVTRDLKGEVTRLEKQVLAGKKDLIETRNTLAEVLEELVKTQGLSDTLIREAKEKTLESAFYDKKTLATKEHVNKLKADLKSMEKDFKRLEAGSKAREDYGAKLRPFPGEGDRQYLTDLKMGGRRIFILVDASASMLGDTIIDVILTRNLGDKEKLKSLKWRQAVDTIAWLTTQLPQTGKFQIYTFNETAAPVIETTKGAWLDAGDPDVLNKVVSRMRKVLPQKGTSLHHAFGALAEINPRPDNIFLLTDSLPTMGTGKPWTKRVSGKKRLSLFKDAMRRLPAGVPVNIILYPMEGDPMAASVFWKLAADTNGSFFCPSRDWP